jgi:diguanylate cyclase (GGDEF)-like protein
LATSETQQTGTAGRAWLLTGPLAALAVLFTTAAQASRSVPGWHWLLAVLFLVVFLAANLAVLRVQVGRHAFVVSVTEVPVLLALFYLAPLPLVAVGVLAMLAAGLYRRQSHVKLWFNVASFAAGTALASLIVRAGLPLDGHDPVTWLLLAAAVTSSILTTHCAVIAVVTLVQGPMSSRELTRTVGPSLVVAAANITIGLVVLVVLQQTVWAALLLAALLVIFVGAYRSYAESVRHSRALTDIYELTKAVTSTPHDGTLPDVLLGRVRELLQSEYATLWIPGRSRYPEVKLSAKVGFDALLDISATPPELRRLAYETGESVAVGPRLGDEVTRAALRVAGQKDMIVVPLRAGSVVIGCLEVTNRLGDMAQFGPGDVRLLETIAAHAAVAVENSRLVDRLRFDAYHDTLTELPNRRRVTDALERAIEARAPDEVVAVLLFDVSRLRDVNESLGRAAGDELLMEVARRLRGAAPAGALVGRLGGDEFVVTTVLGSAESAADLAAGLRDQLRSRLRVGSLALDVDVAVGVAVHPDHGAVPALLLQRADVAAQAAKALTSGVQLFHEALESRATQRLGLAADLRQALEDGELQVYYQPKVAIADRRLVGVECLARWEHPTQGLVAPEDFVAVAEHTGLLGQLTEVVLTDGLRRARQWADAGQPLPVAVNLSPRMLVDPGFPDRVAKLLAEHNVPPELLTLEITEPGVLTDLDRPLPVLTRLAELGIRLAVDDFGTGYGSLSHLRRVPVTEVKIDKSFVQGMATDADDLAIVRAVVDLARHFDLDVVAEGVESELTLELLESIGCGVGQGFLFSRPLPYERLEAWFAARTESESTATGGVRKLRAVG